MRRTEPGLSVSVVGALNQHDLFARHNAASRRSADLPRLAGQVAELFRLEAAWPRVCTTNGGAWF